MLLTHMLHTHLLRIHLLRIHKLQKSLLRVHLLSRQFIFSLLVVTLVGCTSNQAQNQSNDTQSTQKNEQLTTITRADDQKSVVINSGFGSTDIKNWRVLDNRSIIIETYSHGDLLATFNQPCSGIRFSETIGLTTLGPFELDKFTKVLLSDGNWCYIKELVPYIQPASPDDKQ